MIEIRRVIDGDIPRIQNSFFEVFGCDLNALYYKWKYKSAGRWNSFIAYDGDLVVAHIGYSLRFFDIDGVGCLSASRHGSFVLPRWRRKNIYSSLMQYSVKELKELGVDVIQAWPNKNNVKATMGHQDYIPLFQIATLNINFTEGAVLECANDIKNVVEINYSNIVSLADELGKEKSNLWGVIKGVDYLVERYLECPTRTYYIHSFDVDGNKSFIIFGVNCLDLTYINIVEFFSVAGFSSEHLRSFLRDVSGFRCTVQIWRSIYDKEIYTALVRSGFVAGEPIFNTGIYVLGDIQLGTRALRTIPNFSFSMGDTDVF